MYEIVFILMILLFFKYLSEFRLLVAHSILKISEKIVTLGSVIILVMIMILYAKNATDIIFGILGILTVVLMFLNQGISYKGVLRYVRYGKTLLRWEEIKRIEIKEGTTLSVRVYLKTENNPVQLSFDLSKTKIIQEIIRQNAIPFSIT